MKKSPLLKEVAAVKIYKSLREAINDVSDTMTKQHFKTIRKMKKDATASKARAKKLAANPPKPDAR